MVIIAKQEKSCYLPPREYFTAFHDGDDLQFYKYTLTGELERTEERFSNLNPVYHRDTENQIKYAKDNIFVLRTSLPLCIELTNM